MADSPARHRAGARWQHHPLPVIALHWLTAFVLLAVFALALVHDAVDDTGWRAVLLQAHRWTGLALWLIACARLGVRSRLGLTDTDPPLPTLPRWGALAAQAAMYALLLSLPLLGWALTNARGAAVGLPGGRSLPLLLSRDLDLADTLEAVHTALAWTLAGVVGLHMVAALWHHRVRRDRVLVAMWPGLRPRD